MQNNQEINTGNYNQSQRMTQPPNLITTKDLSYLSDALSWELLAMKKCSHFAAECQDQQVGNLLNSIGQMHEQHYNQLLQYVQSNPNVNLQ